MQVDPDLKIVSVDDHVIEPKDLWTQRLPSRLRESAPRVEATHVSDVVYRNGRWNYIESTDGTLARPADVWVYEDTRQFLSGGLCASGNDRDDLTSFPLSYDEDIRPGAYEQAARLRDMARNHTDVSLCFPTVPRFCGQRFSLGKDKELGLECLKVYNNWMIEEWCGGEGKGSLIPVTLVPLWDAELAAAEIRRCANLGSHAVSFSECPPFLGLPSLYSRYWDPFIAACEETETVINLHVGSSSSVPSTADDMLHAVSSILLWEYGMHATLDWIMSGAIERFPLIRIALNEVQAGWIPFVLERADNVWHNNGAIDQQADHMRDLVPNPPSSYLTGHIFSCIYDDLHGLQSRDKIGLGQLLFETDYPHADSTWPHSMDTAVGLATNAGLTDDEFRSFIRGNAVNAFGLDKYFGVKG